MGAGAFIWGILMMLKRLIGYAIRAVCYCILYLLIFVLLCALLLMFSYHIWFDPNFGAHRDLYLIITLGCVTLVMAKNFTYKTFVLWLFICFMASKIPWLPVDNSVGNSVYATAWLGYDHEITPAPEPATYGLLFTGLALGAVGLHRYRRRRAA